jgi:hypothetical protein
MNAIITAATGYTEEHLRIFLWSIEKNCKDTLVYLIAYRDRQIIEKLQMKYPFLRPVYISSSIRKQFARLANYQTRPSFTWLASQLSKRKYSATIGPVRLIGQLALRIIHERFFIALQILQSHRNVFSNVLLTDCRDVVIQRDPFSHLDGKLFSGLEAKTIRHEQWNASWIEKAYGSDILNRLQDQPIVCAGVTLGPEEKVVNYLTKLCEEMWRQLPQVIFNDVGYDQAAHIYLIFEKQIEVELTSNYQGLIASIIHENSADFSVDFTRGLVKIYDNYPAIIHQYDRHPELVYFFDKLVANGESAEQSKKYILHI